MAKRSVRLQRQLVASKVSSKVFGIPGFQDLEVLKNNLLEELNVCTSLSTFSVPNPRVERAHDYLSPSFSHVHSFS